MQCRVPDCPGEYEHRLVSRVERYGAETVIIEGIPADVCPVCGEVYFTPEVARRLERLRDALEAGTIRPAGVAKVYRFEAGELERIEP